MKAHLTQEQINDAAEAILDAIIVNAERAPIGELRNLAEAYAIVAEHAVDTYPTRRN